MGQAENSFPRGLLRVQLVGLGVANAVRSRRNRSDGVV